jgi:sugar phosphate isomerase/epimerase
MEPLRIGIQTVLLPGKTIEEKFSNAARYGFDGVEIVVGPDFNLEQHMTEVSKASDQSGLAIAAICTHPIHDPLHDDPEERERRFAALGRLVTLANDLGAAGVVSVPRRPAERFSSHEERLQRNRELADHAVDEFGRWAETLPSGNAAVFLEPLNRYEASFLNTVGQATDIARRVNNRSVLALADLFHMNIEEASIADALEEADQLLGHVHIADNNRLQPGAGCLDLIPAFSTLHNIGYAGYVSIECFSPTGPRIDGDPETALPETVRYLRHQWERSLNA